MVCRKKLLHSLVVRTQMLWYLFPDGRRVKGVCDGFVGSPTMLLALRLQRVVYMSVTEGRDPNDLFSCNHYPLQGLAIRYGAIAKPSSDAVAQDTLWSFCRARSRWREADGFSSASAGSRGAARLSC